MEKITKEQYENIITGKKDVIVQFSADWCGPCKTLSPILETLGKENNLSVYKLDITEHSEFAMEKGVMSIPYVEIIKSGEVADKFVGSKPKNLIQESVSNVFN